MSTVDDRLAEMPQIYRKQYMKAVNRKSLRAAIKAHCLECCGWEREEVKLCTDTGCPLFQYRPFVPRAVASKKSPESSDFRLQGLFNAPGT
jgi:hypothetical protein